MRLYTLLGLLSFPFLCSAQQSVLRYEHSDIVMIGKDDQLPVGVKEMGKIRVTDGMLKMNCGYFETVDEAKGKAAKVGANILQITEVKPPDVLSTCYRLRANAYHTDNIAAVRQDEARRDDSVIASLLPDTARYALLYIYRPVSHLGSAMNFQVTADGEPVGRVYDNVAYKVRLTKQGPTLFRSQIADGIVEETIDVRFGQAYFLRCEILQGVFMGRPGMYFEPAKKGYRTYAKMMALRKEKTKKPVDEFYNYMKE